MKMIHDSYSDISQMFLSLSFLIKSDCVLTTIHYNEVSSLAAVCVCWPNYWKLLDIKVLPRKCHLPVPHNWTGEVKYNCDTYLMSLFYHLTIQIFNTISTLSRLLKIYIG